MADVLNLQKQKEILENKQINDEIQKQESKFADPREIQKETETKDHAERMKKIGDSMQEFAGIFQNEWAKKEKIEGNKFRSTVNFFVGLKHSEFKNYASLNSFAYSSDTYKKNEKRSATATDLMDSLNDWYNLTKDKNAMPDTAESVQKLLELSQTANNYCITHDKGYFSTKIGKGRAVIAEKVKKMTSACLDKLLSDKDRDDIYSNDGADYQEGESDKTIQEDLKRAAKAYFNFSIQLAEKCKGRSPGDFLNRRLKVLRVNDRKIRWYRNHFPEEDKRDELINKMIHEYEECLAWEKVLKFTSEKEIEEDDYDKMIDEHLVEEGEIESTEKDKVKPISEDEELEPEQLKGISDIDNWLIRNFRNGGVLGTVLPFLKNTNFDFINRVLSLSKRERLHMYYLVEKKKRRDSNILDVGLSQTYVPNLKEFKDQMVATRFKFWKRMNGDYTYMNKLSDAFAVMSKYRKEIKAVALVEQDKKKEIENVDKKQNEGAPVDASVERMQKMMLLKGALEEYGRNLNSAKKADKKKKAAAEAICKESAAYCEQLMKELVDIDESVGAEEIHMRQAETTESQVSDATSKYKFAGNVPGYVQTGLTKGNTYFWKKWDLKSAGWTKANLWTGSIGEAAGGVAQLIGVATTIVSLWKAGDQMSGAEISEKTFQMAQSLVSATQNAFNIKYLVDTGGAILKTAEQTQAKEVMGASFAAVGAVVSTAVAISKTVGVCKMQYHGEKAGEFFENKRKKLEKDGKDNLTKEQKRELKYEKHMMRLQEDLKQREATKAVYSGAGAGLAFVSVAIPVVGFANMALSIVGSIHDGIQVTKLRTKLFDSFFNLDALAEKVTKERYKGRKKDYAHNIVNEPKEQVKEALRLRLAAYAGFCDLKTATEYVCTQFARLIRSKLFGEGVDEKERKGYTEFVKAINLRVNEKKGLPDENILVRKLSAQ